MSESLFIGMISGTSRDGVDAALLRFVGDTPEVAAALCYPYPRPLAMALESTLRAGRRPTETALQNLGAQIGEAFGKAALKLLKKTGVEARSVTAIGSHGQTVWHDPQGAPPESIQLGDPVRIVRMTGICTVADFRRADIEAGGQGAPLAPLLHQALLSPDSHTRVVLNLGGIANVSILRPGRAVEGFDTGPANCLLDAWIRAQRARPFDRDGKWSAGGRVDQDLLDTLLGDPWFSKAPPKSTGIEYFNATWLAQQMGDTPRAARDVQATLAQLTAVTTADAVRACTATELLLCGGGTHNSDLVRRIRTRLPGVKVHVTTAAGLDPDWVEAALFAWLARERLAERRQDTRSITGAREPVLLGAVFDPDRDAHCSG
ncbi:MAG: anhydro-N-acetylmuramic acid kinase [Xanthomonadales bacterium]|nr:anhydro-N-acetylmuramic acid kinase [Xanthomonadales bacterium]